MLKWLAKEKGRGLARPDIESAMAEDESELKGTRCVAKFCIGGRVELGGGNPGLLVPDASRQEAEANMKLYSSLNPLKIN